MLRLTWIIFIIMLCPRLSYSQLHELSIDSLQRLVKEEGNQQKQLPIIVELISKELANYDQYKELLPKQIAKGLTWSQELKDERSYYRMLTNKGAFLSYQHKDSAAISLLLKSTPHLKASKDLHWLARNHHRLAWIYRNHTANQAKAAPLLRQADSLFLLVQDTLSWGNAKQEIGYALCDLGHFSEALKHFKEVKQAYEQIDHHVGSATMLNNMAIVYRSQKKYEEALKLSNQSIDELSALKDSVAIMFPLSFKVDLLTSLDRLEEASTIAKQLINIASQHRQSTKNIERMYVRIGRLERKRGNYNQAITYYKEFMRRSPKGTPRLQTLVYAGLSDSYLQKNELVKAYQYAQMAYTRGKKANNLYALREATHVYANVQQNRNQHQHALQLFKQFKILGDSIQNKETTLEIERLIQVKEYEANKERLALENALLKQQVSAETAKENYLLMAVIVLCIGVIGTGFAYRAKQRVNLELEKSKALILAKNTVLEQKNEAIASHHDQLEEANKALRNKEAILQQRNKELGANEEELQQQADELLTINDSLESTLKQLQDTQRHLVDSEKMVALGQLVASIAHELNTPLGAIQSSSTSSQRNLDKLIGKSFDALRYLTPEDYQPFYRLTTQLASANYSVAGNQVRQQRKALTEIFKPHFPENFQMMARMLQDFSPKHMDDGMIEFLKRTHAMKLVSLALDIASLYKLNEIMQIASGKSAKIIQALKIYAHYSIDDNKEEASIVKGIESTLTLCHNQLKSGIEVECRFEDQLEIVCYPDELNQVWMNLIQNAMYAMDYQGKLVLSTRLEKKIAVIQISDTGKGMPEEVQERIFEPLFTTKPIGEGSGLGLSIVKKIIDKHEGDIQVETEPTKGTTFIIRLPILPLVKGNK